MRVLHLTLKKKWFDLIASGKKVHEFREDKPYWRKRLVDEHLGIGNHFDIVRFRNGYRKDAPEMDVECKGISFTHPKWFTFKNGESFDCDVIVISLGKVLRLSNIACNRPAFGSGEAGESLESAGG